MEQIQIGADPQVLQRAAHPGGTQVQGPLLDVLPARQHLIGRQLAGDHPGVAGVLPEPAHVRLPARGFLPLAGRVRIQLQHQLVRGVPHLPERHARRRPGQDRIGFRGVRVTEDAGLVLDDPQVDRVDPAGGQRGEGPGKPPGHGAGVVHLAGGRQRGQVQLIGQLIGGELILRAPAGVPGGELSDRGHQRPRRTGLQPPGGGDDPHQLVIGQPGQPGAVLAGDGVHDGGEERAGGHRVGGGALGEPGQGQLLGREGHVQALPQARGVLGGRDVVRLRVVWPGVGERVLGHAPRSVRKK